MSYQGMMDGWHGDEYECNGHCGYCDDCYEARQQQGELEYESDREND